MLRLCALYCYVFALVNLCSYVETLMYQMHKHVFT